MHIPAALAPWAAAMATDSYSPRTIATRIRVIRQIAAHNKLEDLMTMSDEHVRKYLSDHDLKPWSIIKYLDHVRAFAKWHGLDDPTAEIRRPRRPKGIPRPLAEESFRRLVAHTRARDHTLYTWTLLGGYCGLRAFEAAKVAVEDIDPHARELYVLGKGRVEATLPLAPVVLDALTTAAAGLGSTGRLWPKAHSITVSHEVAIAAAQIGIPMEYHQLRHRFGTQLYRTSKDLLLTQKLMRHASPTTTAGYALVADDSHAAAVQGLPGADLA
jgi:integrase